MSGDIAAERRSQTALILRQFRSRLEARVGSDAASVLGDHTTVYVTGSGGRGEMSAASDLDLFVVRVDGTPSELDAQILRTAITKATEDCGIVPPSRGGEFLEMHSADDFRSMLGSQEDDAKNKFTARMLLLLEGAPVLGDVAYDTLVGRMIESYWSTSAEHPDSYLPFVFVNDVIRYWRVVLLNHEAHLRRKQSELEAAGETQLEHRMKVERYIRSFKLRFPRCVSCFGSLAYLLAFTRTRDHVSTDDMRAMIRLTPFERVEEAARMVPDTNATVERMRGLYAGFLEEYAHPKSDLLARFGDLGHASRHARSGSEFADAVFELITMLGAEGAAGKRPNSLFRYMLV